MDGGVYARTSLRARDRLGTSSSYGSMFLSHVRGKMYFYWLSTIF